MEQEREDYRDGPPRVRPWWIGDVVYPAAVALGILGAVASTILLIALSH
jgi:hypothetical protein